MSSLIAGIIVKYLGEYCDVKEEDVSLSVFSGKGTMTNLVLKPEAFTPFDLPVTISRAVIRHIEFEIPWTSMGSSPCIATVSDIHVCVAPPPTELSDREKKERLERARERLVSAFEESRKAAFQMAQLAKAGAKEEEPGYASRMAEVIINNLIVEISNVHLRYECKHSEASGIPHTVLGLTLSGVKLQTTDDKGMPTFIDPTAATTCHKRLSLSDLRLYSEVGDAVELATDNASKTDPRQVAAWDRIMTRQLDSNSYNYDGGNATSVPASSFSSPVDASVACSTIFGPVRGNARATFVQKKHIATHKSTPRIAVNLSIENVAAAWTRDQYLCVLRAGIEMSEATARLSKLVAPDPREELWPEYERLYTKVVFGSATPADETRLTELFDSMPGESVVRCRKTVYRSVKEDLAKKRKQEDERVKQLMEIRAKEKERLIKEKEKAGFFGGMFMSTATSVHKKDVEEETAKKEAEWKALENQFGVLDADEEAPDLTDLPEDYVWIKVAVSIPSVSTRLNLQEGGRGGAGGNNYFVAPCIAELSGTQLNYCKFNKAGCMDVELSTRQLTVTNPTASHKTLPNIVFVSSSSSSSSNNSGAAAAAAAVSSTATIITTTHLLTVTAKLKPLHREIKDTTLDIDLGLKFEPLHVVADPVLLSRLGNFFTVPSKARLITDTIGRSAAYQAASEASKMAASSSLAQVQDTMATQQVMRISVDAAAPVVFLPVSVATLTDTSPMLCASLGRVVLTSSPPTDAVKQRRHAEITNAVANKSVSKLPNEVVFDRYVATLTGMAVAQSRWGHRTTFVAESGDLERAATSTTSFFLLPPVQLKCDLSTPLLPQLDEFVPPLVVRGSSEGLFVRVEHGAADIVMTQVAGPWLAALQAVEVEAKEIAAATIVASPSHSLTSFSPRAADDEDDDASAGFDVQEFIIDVDNAADAASTHDQLAKVLTESSVTKHVADIKFSAAAFALELIEPGSSTYICQAAPIELSLMSTNKSTFAVFDLAAFSLFDRERGPSSAIIPATGLHVVYLQNVIANAMDVDVTFSGAVELALGQPLVDITENALGLLAILSKLGKQQQQQTASSDIAIEQQQQQQQRNAATTSSVQQQQQQQQQQSAGSMLVKLKAPAVAIALLAPSYSTHKCFQMEILSIDLSLDSKTTKVAVKNDGGEADEEENRQDRFDTRQKIVAGIQAISLDDGINKVPVITSHLSDIQQGDSSGASPTHSAKWMQVTMTIFNSTDDAMHDDTAIDLALTSINVVAFAPSLVGLVSYATAPSGIVAGFIQLFCRKASQLAELSGGGGGDQPKLAAVSAASTATAAEAATSSSSSSVLSAAAALSAKQQRHQQRQEQQRHRERELLKRQKLKADAAVMNINANVRSVTVTLLGKSDRQPIFSLALNRAGADVQMCTAFPEKNHIKARAGEVNLRDSRTKDSMYPNLISTLEGTASGNNNNSETNFIVFEKVPIVDAINRKRNKTQQQGEQQQQIVEFEEQVTLEMSEMVVVYTPCIISYIVTELQSVVTALNDAAKSETLATMRADAESIGAKMGATATITTTTTTTMTGTAAEGSASSLSTAAAEQKKADENDHSAAASPASPPMKLIVDMKSLRLLAALNPRQPARVVVTPGSLTVRNEISCSHEQHEQLPKEKISVVMKGTEIVVLDSSVMSVSDSEIRASVTRKIGTVEQQQQMSATFRKKRSKTDFDTDVELELSNIRLNLNKEQYELLLAIGGDSLSSVEQLEIPVELQELQKEIEQQHQQQQQQQSAADDDDDNDLGADATNNNNAAEATTSTSSTAVAVAKEEEAAAVASSTRVKAVVHSIEIQLLQQFMFTMAGLEFTMHSTPGVVAELLTNTSNNSSNNDENDELILSRIAIKIGDIAFACDEDGDGANDEDETVLRIAKGTNIRIISSEKRDQEASMAAAKKGEPPVWFDSSDLAISVPPLLVHARASTIRSVMSNIVAPANRLLLKAEAARPRIHFNTEHLIVLEKDTTIDSMHFLQCSSAGSKGLVHFCLDLGGHCLTLHPSCFVRGLAPGAETLVRLDSNCMLEVKNGTVRAPAGFAVHSWISFAAGSKMLLDTDSVSVLPLQWKSTSFASLVSSQAEGMGAAAAMQAKHARGSRFVDPNNNNDAGTEHRQMAQQFVAQKIQQKQQATQAQAAQQEGRLAAQRQKRHAQSAITVTAADLRVCVHSETSHYPLQQLSLETVKVILVTHTELKGAQRVLKRRIEICTPRMQSVGDELGSNCLEIMPVSVSVSLDGVDQQRIQINLPDLQIATRISRALVLVDEVNQLLVVVAAPPEEEGGSDTTNARQQQQQQQQQQQDDDEELLDAAAGKVEAASPVLTPSDNLVAAIRLAPGHQFIAVKQQQQQLQQTVSSEDNKLPRSTSSSNKNATLQVTCTLNSANIMIVGVTSNSYAEVQLSRVQALVDVLPILTLGASLHVAVSLYNPRPASWEILLDDTKIDFTLSSAQNENMVALATGPVETFFSPDTLKSLLALVGSSNSGGGGGEGSIGGEEAAAIQERAAELAAHMMKENKSATEISRALAQERKERQVAEMARALHVSVKNYSDDAISIDKGAFVCNNHSVDAVYSRKTGSGQQQQQQLQQSSPAASTPSSRMLVDFLRSRQNVAPVAINPTRNFLSWLGEHIISYEVEEEKRKASGSGSDSDNNLASSTSFSSSPALLTPGTAAALQSRSAFGSSAHFSTYNADIVASMMQSSKRSTISIYPVHRRGPETLLSIKSHIMDADLKICGIVDLLKPGEQVFLTTKIDLETHFLLQPVSHRSFHSAKFSTPCDTGLDIYPLTLRGIYDGFSCQLTAVADLNAARCYFRVQATNRGMVMGVPHLEISIFGGLSLSSDLPWPMTVSWVAGANAGMAMTQLMPFEKREVTTLNGSDVVPLSVSVRDMNVEGRVFLSKPTNFSVQKAEAETAASGASDDQKQFMRCVLTLQQGTAGSGTQVEQEMAIRAAVSDGAIHFYTPFVLCNNTSIPLQLHCAHDPTPERRNFRDCRAFRPSGQLIDPPPRTGTLEKGDRNDGNELFMHVSFNNMSTIAAIPLHAVGVPGVFEMHANADEDNPNNTATGNGEVYHMCFNTFFSSTRRDTRTIVITPRWIIVNRLPFRIRIGQDCSLSHGRDETWAPQHAMRIKPNEASDAYAWSVATTKTHHVDPSDDSSPSSASSSSPGGDSFDVVTSDDAVVAGKPLAAFVAVVAREDEDTKPQQQQRREAAAATAAAESQAAATGFHHNKRAWTVRGKSPAAFTIDSSSTWSICIPYLDGESNPRLIAAEADVVKQGYYVYVTLRLPAQPAVLLLNRLSTPITVEDKLLRNSGTLVAPYSQRGVLTLPPNGVDDQERHKEAAKEKVKRENENAKKSKDGGGNKKNDASAAAAAAAAAAVGREAADSGANWLIHLGLAGDAKTTVDLFAGFVREATPTGVAADKNNSKNQSPASPLSPPHAASPTVLRPNADVQIVLTRGAGGQRIVTVLPTPNGKYDTLHRSSRNSPGTTTTTASSFGGIIALTEPPPLDFFVKLEVPRFSLSLCHNSSEIARVGLDGIRANVRRAGFEEAFALIVDDLAIDNMCEARPIHEVAVFAFRKEQAKPAIMFELKKKVSLAPRFVDIENLLVDIQPLIVKVGDRFILSLLQCIDAFTGSGADDADDAGRVFFVKTPTPRDLFTSSPGAEAGYSVMDTTVVIDDFAFNPLAIRIWLSRQSDADFLKKHFNQSGVVSMLAMNLEDVAIIADGVVFSQRQDSAAQLINYFNSLFTDKLKTQLVGLALQYVGSIPFLGAPVKFLHTLGKGVTRFIVDPITDIRSPAQRAAAFAKGGMAMVGGVVGGAIGLVGDVAQSAAKVANIAAGSGANDAASKSKVPGTIRGLARGLGGLVYKPWEGAANNGVKGFFKGLGHGLVGIVADPVAGVLSDVGKVSGKVADFLTDKALPTVRRARAPRGFTATGGAARPGQTIEIFEVERFGNEADGWVKDGFPPTEAGPWRDGRNKSTTKTVVESAHKASLTRLLLIQQQQGGAGSGESAKRPLDPKSNESLALASTGGYASDQAGISPFVALWKTDRFATNYSGWSYARPGKLEFLTEPSRKHTIRRRRWVVSLPCADTLTNSTSATAVSDSSSFSSSTSAGAGAATASRIRQQVVGKSDRGRTDPSLYAAPLPVRRYDKAQDLFPPPPGCVAWVAEAIHNERHYIFSWGAPGMPADPPTHASRREVALPGGSKEKAFAMLPSSDYVWITPEWIDLGVRYSYFFRADGFDSTEKGARACRRTVYRKMLAIKRGVESFQPTAAASSTQQQQQQQPNTGAAAAAASK